MHARFTWDIFCRVVDNFGDAGVCWRLARQLALEEGESVRLWIDELESLERLVPALSSTREVQEVEGVSVRRWPRSLPATEPAAIVVEAFGCGLPDEYVNAMAKAAQRPLWIVLEYLSAEPWVREHHRLPSPHPRLALERYYFFPGFVAGTGGLLRERDLLERRERFGAADRERAWRRLGHEAQPAGATSVSLFGYESAPVHALLGAWEAGPERVVAAVPEGRMLPVVLRYFGSDPQSRERVLRRGALEVRVVPFTAQALYDELLWTCDINFVRGEDSFVRAQWAARPFAWHIYPQHDLAHARKLDAFLALYGEALPGDARAAASDLMRVWNGIDVPGVTVARAWAAFARARGVLQAHGDRWARQVAAVGGLAANLARFCRGRLK